MATSTPGLSNELAQIMAMQALAQQGRRGDSMVANLSPQEMEQLKDLGGAGTDNPTTGLPQFFGDDVGGPVTVDPLATTPDSTIGTSTPLADSPSDFSQAMDAYNKRDYLSRLGGALGGMFGIDEMQPNESDPTSYAGGTWHTHFNPGTAIGDIAGLALGGKHYGLSGALAGGQLGRLGYNKLFGPDTSQTSDTAGQATDTTGATDPKGASMQKLYLLARMGLLKL
jgi:hypothetical protein